MNGSKRIQRQLVIDELEQRVVPAALSVGGDSPPPELGHMDVAVEGTPVDETPAARNAVSDMGGDVFGICDDGDCPPFLTLDASKTDQSSASGPARVGNVGTDINGPLFLTLPMTDDMGRSVAPEFARLEGIGNDSSVDGRSVAPEFARLEGIGNDTDIDSRSVAPEVGRLEGVGDDIEGDGRVGGVGADINGDRSIPPVPEPFPARIAGLGNDFDTDRSTSTRPSMLTFPMPDDMARSVPPGPANPIGAGSISTFGSLKSAAAMRTDLR